MQSMVAIHALGGEPGPKVAVRFPNMFLQHVLSIYKLLESLLYEVPGGNQVDGLPPAASNARLGKSRWLGTRHIYGNAGFHT